MPRVKNINGTSQNKCSCGSWLKHWERFSGQLALLCIEKNCLNMDLVGAHVQKAGAYDSKWYIIPLCNSHNKSKEELEINDNYQMVSANKVETCEKL